MDITVKVRPEVAQALHGEVAGPAASEAQDVQEAVRAAGGTIVPLHPGESDPELSTYFLVTAAEGSAEGLLARLRSHAAIEGAYAKPADEAP